MFQAYTDGHLRVLNSLFPPVVARFVRLQPLSWHGRASVQVQVLGCPFSKLTPRSRSPAGGYSHYFSGLNMSVDGAGSWAYSWFSDGPTEIPPIINTDTSQTSTAPTSTEGPVLVETRLSTYLYQLYHLNHTWKQHDSSLTFNTVYIATYRSPACMYTIHVCVLTQSLAVRQMPVSQS